MANAVALDELHARDDLLKRRFLECAPHRVLQEGRDDRILLVERDLTAGSRKEKRILAHARGSIDYAQLLTTLYLRHLHEELVRQIMVLKTLLQLREISAHRLIAIRERKAVRVHGEPDRTFSGTGRRRRSLCIRDDPRMFCRRCWAFIHFFLRFVHSRCREHVCFF